MNTEALLRVLTKLADLLSASGAKADAAEVKEFGSLLEGQKNRPLDETLGKVKVLLAQGESRLPDRHLGDLIAAGTEEILFDAALQAIQNDRSLSKEQVADISLKYSRRGKANTSKKEAFANIRKRFIEMTYEKDRMAIVKTYKTG